MQLGGSKWPPRVKISSSYTEILADPGVLPASIFRACAGTVAILHCDPSTPKVDLCYMASRLKVCARLAWGPSLYTITTMYERDWSIKECLNLPQNWILHQQESQSSSLQNFQSQSLPLSTTIHFTASSNSQPIFIQNVCQHFQACYCDSCHHPLCQLGPRCANRWSLFQLVDP